MNVQIARRHAPSCSLEPPLLELETDAAAFAAFWSAGSGPAKWKAGGAGTGEKRNREVGRFKWRHEFLGPQVVEHTKVHETTVAAIFRPGSACLKIVRCD